MPSLVDYEPIIGAAAVDSLVLLAKQLNGQRIVMVNSTKMGGGVAEILNRMVPLMEELGLSVRWEVVEGSPLFYRVTKSMHNALHGKQEPITEPMRELFIETGRQNAARMQVDDDIVFIHDPQPIVLVEQRKRNKDSRWLWRCHVDVSRPSRSVWDLLEPYILQYDAAVYSAAAFVQKLPMRQVLIAPSIDPFSDKNCDLSQDEVNSFMRQLEIPQDIPVITQVSRFDYLKDPVGVVETFLRVRKSVKCRLVLAGGPANDDPEGEAVLAKTHEAAKGHPEIHVLMLPPDSHRAINALQRASTVILQKSLREGFGLTVSEALWKGKPVVASAVGGIPLQVQHGHNGLLVHSIDGATHAVKHLLNNPDYAKRLGENGREHVRQNFLLTRHLQEYLLTFLLLGRPEEVLALSG